jgi:tetratricopeptide (TPR) repeat protein
VKPAHTLLALVVTAMLFAAAVAALRARERWYPMSGPNPGDATMYITSGNALRRMSIGYSALASDLYWIRAIQYYGGTRLRLAAGSDAPSDVRTYPLLYPMLDVTTTLDPRFNIAYRFGAIFLAEPYPGGAGRPDLAIALLEKGLRARPDKWEYMQDIGFVHYWWRHDYHAAADWFNRASRVPGAPWWLRSLAAVTLAEGGDRRSSRIMWQSIRETAELDWLRHEAERRLSQLQALDDIDALQKKADFVAARTGTVPANWQTFISTGVLPRVPTDPSGTPYELDAGGRVHLSRISPLFPLPDEPKRAAAPAS